MTEPQPTDEAKPVEEEKPRRKHKQEPKGDPDVKLEMIDNPRLVKALDLIALEDGFTLRRIVSTPSNRSGVYVQYVDSQGRTETRHIDALRINTKAANIADVPIDTETETETEIDDMKKKNAKKAAPKAKTPKKDPGPCMCGCGGTVNGRFRQGHDAKLHGMVVQAARDGKKLPADVRKLAGEYIKQRWPKEAKVAL